MTAASIELVQRRSGALIFGSLNIIQTVQEEKLSLMFILLVYHTHANSSCEEKLLPLMFWLTFKGLLAKVEEHNANIPPVVLIYNSS